ncbi:hypothetical protein L484_016790 [Morus notabilis]|uniref:Uncharacterized protein n=1 Tax=Morus notabilis TaxID=981085 RepID=W9SF03_9ROSA|nr:hypothetical protein L484_016790 [Morus notabilis]
MSLESNLSTADCIDLGESRRERGVARREREESEEGGGERDLMPTEERNLAMMEERETLGPYTKKRPDESGERAHRTHVRL